MFWFKKRKLPPIPEGVSFEPNAVYLEILEHQNAHYSAVVLHNIYHGDECTCTVRCRLCPTPKEN